MTSSTAIIPTYRALTIVGNVLAKDEVGEMHHAVVVHTTLDAEVHVMYVIVPQR